jgi:adenosylcobinamide-GDP ribazoletransferase
LINAVALWRALLFAGRFLTRWPLPNPGMPTAAELGPEMGRAALFYPLIGLLLGAALAGLALLLKDAPTLAAAAVLLIFWVWSTGALHLDGLADCADAWVGGLGSRARTLEILKDPRTGAMGVVTLVLALLGKFAGTAALLEAARIGPVLVLAWLPVLARAQLLLLALTTPYARADGMGAAMRSHLPRNAAWLVVVVSWCVAALLAVIAFGPRGLALPLLALVVFWIWRRSLLRRLGGYTGDGTLLELTATLLLLFAALLPAAAS